MIQALGLSFTVPTIGLAAALGAGGAFALGDVGASTAALAPALLGMAAGGALRGRFSDFRRVFFGGIAGARRSPRVAGGDLKFSPRVLGVSIKASSPPSPSPPRITLVEKRRELCYGLMRINSRHAYFIIFQHMENRRAKRR